MKHKNNKKSLKASVSYGAISGGLIFVKLVSNRERGWKSIWRINGPEFSKLTKTVITQIQEVPLTTWNMKSTIPRHILNKLVRTSDKVFKVAKGGGKDALYMEIKIRITSYFSLGTMEVSQQSNIFKVGHIFKVEHL